VFGGGDAVLVRRREHLCGFQHLGKVSLGFGQTRLNGLEGITDEEGSFFLELENSRFERIVEEVTRGCASVDFSKSVDCASVDFSKSVEEATILYE
jgi:hypothetical protein